MRIFRVVLGVVIVLVAIWIIVGEQMAGASANAVVNARLSTLRAPVAGEVDLPARRLGSRVTAGEEIGSVTDPLVDRVRLADLEMEQAFASAEVARLRTLIEETQGVQQALGERSTRFTERQIADLRLRLEHARDRLALLGVVVGNSSSEASLAGDAESVEQSRVREEVDVLENAIAAAEAGVFVGGGYNDAPNAEQRRIELVTQIDALEADLAEAQQRLAAIENRVNTERLSVNQLAGGPISSTVNGRIWELLTADGERLQRGESVLRLIDCDSIFVTLSVTESIYNRLQIGDEARFRLSGSGDVHPGTVARLAGSGAATIYQNLAIAPSERHLERYDVALSVPGLTADPELSCPVGRTGRAFFEGRPLDWLRGLF